MRLPLILTLVLSACVSSPSSDRAILAIGDSIMAWNGGQGIPEAVGQTLDRPVTDASQSLAQVTNPNGAAGALGFDITRQFAGSGWDWVILTGGGNDIRSDCATPQAGATRDGLIGPDLTGDIPSLIAGIRATGAKVAFVGYYDGAEAAPTGFTPCQPEFDIMNRRLGALAARDAGVLFFDAGEVIDPGDTGLYAGDLVHPSPRGSAVIGVELARRMLAFEAGR
ncbi:SGNH/GDSL hydrolase family protein [Jannaschia sp. 2305UL9-9]|uniref:SGNH/GDSL hydrolase family protein n=1 Tax=Jannaschia sp. 2305UL9-9 TaxID=3121638 RepID=UPI003527A79D